MIFHEDLFEPVHRLTAPKILSKVLDEAILSYSQLSIPRIYSQARLLDLCPAEGSKPISQYVLKSEQRQNSFSHHSVQSNNDSHVCLVLLLHSKRSSVMEQVGFEWLRLYRDLIRRLHGQLDKIILANDQFGHLMPVYMYMDLQSEFFRYLKNSKKSSFCLDQKELCDFGPGILFIVCF